MLRCGPCQGGTAGRLRQGNCDPIGHLIAAPRIPKLHTLLKVGSKHCAGVSPQPTGELPAPDRLVGVRHDRAEAQTRTATPASPGLGEQLVQGVRFHRLDEMVVEARLLRTTPILLLPPASHRHQQQVFQAGPLA